MISTDNEASAKACVLMYYGVTDVSVANQFRQVGNLHRSHSPGRQTRRFARSGPDKYTLIINLKTAKALGLTISREMMLIADELLE